MGNPMHAEKGAGINRPLYYAEISYYDCPRNKKKFVTLREENATFQVVQDMIALVLEKINKGTAELREVSVFRVDEEGYEY